MNITRRNMLAAAAGLAATGGWPRGAEANAPQPALASLSDYEAAARERMAHMAWEYINGGAADEATLRWNREAFERVRLAPRALVDVSHLDTRVKLFGQELPFPILLAPTAYHGLVHAEGELATVRGAGAANAAMVISTAANTRVEEIAAAATGPVWFQLYIQRDRGFTRDLVQRAVTAGCRALVLTVDTPVTGPRNRETRTGFALPAGLGLPNLQGLKVDANAHRSREGSIYSPITDPSVTWKEIDWLRSFARVPVLLKGILHPEDAALAVKAGASGLIVSNHGGRNLDTVPATIEALPPITQRVAGRLPILMDGGIRRGTDVLKALAYGARAVLIGRPYLHGLGVAGAHGVTRVVEILRQEFEMAMALSGRASLAHLDRSLLWPPRNPREK
ncbi:MAG: alpha-hydroxy acid oxidase [Blastocatellia bacterium]|nr:alpha-hydroxy acid oxidase [Blastocatellia bacterium]